MRIKTQRSIPTRFIASVIIVTLVLLVFVSSRLALAAGETIPAVPDKTTYESQQITITDLQVNGTGNDELNMNLHVNEGSLDFSSSAGLVFDGPTSGADLQFSGTRSAINAALSNLRYVSNTPGEFTVEASLGGGDGDVYNPANGHVYQVVTVGGEGIDWTDARNTAASRIYGGVNGYLATITSQQEQDFIQARLSQDGWIGATDSADEGEWYWTTDPSDISGTQHFWTGDDGESSGSLVEGAYANWNTDGEADEPNNNTSTNEDGEDCAEVRFTGGANGKWNDRDCLASNQAYVVEFGTEDELPSIASTSFTVTVEEAPEIAFTALNPADNSTVLPTENLTITYNQPMSIGELYFRVYNAETDEMVEELWTGVTGNNLTFTHTLSEKLAPGSYYVTVSDSGMIGIADYYHGFDDKTTWNFTIADGDGISDVVENAAPNGGDANDDGTLDSMQENVASFINPVTNDYVSLAVISGCAIADVSIVESEELTVDGEYKYPAGLMDFTLDCGTPGFTATIQQYYYGLDDETFVVRKYNPATQAYATIESADVERRMIEGAPVEIATYTVTDGSELDLDGTVNGEIVDPAGLALLAADNSGSGSSGEDAFSGVGTPNTGTEPVSLMTSILFGIAGIALVIVAGFFTYRRLRERA